MLKYNVLVASKYVHRSGPHIIISKTDQN